MAHILHLTCSTIRELRGIRIFMENLRARKEALLRELIEGGWLKTKRVIEAFRKVPREDFVLDEYKKYAYVNEPLTIGYGQTISQPLTVAAMTEVLDVRKEHV